MRLDKSSSIWDIWKKVKASPWMKSKNGSLYVDTKTWIKHKKNESKI